MGCFCVLVLVNKVAMYLCVRIFETLSSILLYLYPELKLLGHMVIIFLIFFFFVETPYCFPEWLCYFSFPLICVQRF